MTNSQVTGKPAAPRRSRPIVVYLVVLALVAFVPVMAFAAVLLQRNNEAQQEIVQTLIMATTEAIGRAVDGQTEGMITTLKGFSSAPKATDSDLRDLYTRAQYALAGTGSYLALVDDTYQALFTTRVPYGTPLPKSPPSPGIQKAFETGQIVISDATFGATAGTWVIAIYMPIAGPNGHRELLAITQNADSVGAALLGRKLPEDWKVALSDSKNVVIASSPDAKLDFLRCKFLRRTFVALGDAVNIFGLNAAQECRLIPLGELRGAPEDHVMIIASPHFPCCQFETPSAHLCGVERDT